MDFAILRLRGNHYENYRAAEGRSVSRFLDLPEVVRSRVLSSAGTWFAALDPQTLASEPDAAGRGAVAGEGAPAPSRGIDARGPESRSETGPAPSDAMCECNGSDAESRWRGGGNQERHTGGLY